MRTARARPHTTSLSSPHFGRPLDVVLEPQRTPCGTLARAPLTVVLTGLANELDAPLPRLAVEHARARGHHVLVIPNSFTATYLRAAPRAAVADVLGEAQAILDVTRRACERIGPQAISRRHLYGESFGALTAAIVKATDLESGSGMFDGPTTLVAPPLSYVTGMEQVDEAIERNRRRPRLHWLRLAFLGFKALLWFFGARVGLRADRALVEAFVAHHFRRSIVQNCRNLVEHLGLPPPPQRFEDLDTNRRATAAMLAPQRNPFVTGETTGRYFLDYWLQRLDAAGDRSWRILMSVDDFINRQADTRELAASYPDHVLLLPGGGHLGFVGWQRFGELADSIYGVRPREMTTATPTQGAGAVLGATG